MFCCVRYCYYKMQVNLITMKIKVGIKWEECQVQRCASAVLWQLTLWVSLCLWTLATCLSPWNSRQCQFHLTEGRTEVTMVSAREFLYLNKSTCTKNKHKCVCKITFSVKHIWNPLQCWHLFSSASLIYVADTVGCLSNTNTFPLPLLPCAWRLPPLTGAGNTRSSLPCLPCS